MNENIASIIKHLRSVDLIEYPFENIKDLLCGFDNIGHISLRLNVGTLIYRARINDSINHFRSVDQLSYKPQVNNNTFQRASSPNQSMFYGTFFPDFIKYKRVDPRLIVSYEAVPWLRDLKTKGIKTITYSTWVVTKPINFIAIVQAEKYFKKSPVNQKLSSEYNQFIKSLNEESSVSKYVTSFIADEFAKDIINTHVDYKISAAFTELTVNNGFDGVIYPSVRMAGEYLNVAICPETTDNSLILKQAIECTIYKKHLRTVIDNEFETDIFPNPSYFKMHKIINPIEHAGQIRCLHQIGVKSIAELK